MTNGGRPPGRGYRKKASERKGRGKGKERKTSVKLKKWLPAALAEERGC
jgi:hypothetical protein